MTAHSKRENCHAERVRTVDPGLAKGEKFVERNPELFGETAEIFAHHFARERIIAGGHRCVGSKNIRRGHDLKRRIEFEFFLNHLSSNPFETEERRVAFVHMKNFGLNPE